MAEEQEPAGAAAGEDHADGSREQAGVGTGRRLSPRVPTGDVLCLPRAARSDERLGLPRVAVREPGVSAPPTLCCVLSIAPPYPRPLP